MWPPGKERGMRTKQGTKSRHRATPPVSVSVANCEGLDLVHLGHTQHAQVSRTRAHIFLGLMCLSAPEPERYF